MEDFDSVEESIRNTRAIPEKETPGPHSIKGSKYEIGRCKDCGGDIPRRKERRGRKPQRCPGCKDKHSKNYMREYSQQKRIREKKEQLERTKNERYGGDWDLDNILDADAIFKPQFYDNGTGVDQGSTED